MKNISSITDTSGDELLTTNRQPDISFVISLLPKLASRLFFGELRVRFQKGSITSVKLEESLPLPSHKGGDSK